MKPVHRLAASAFCLVILTTLATACETTSSAPTGTQAGIQGLDSNSNSSSGQNTSLLSRWQSSRKKNSENSNSSDVTIAGASSPNTFPGPRFFVSTTGVNDPARNATNPATPWRTIQFAIAQPAVVAGSTIAVFNGTYTGGILIPRKLRIINAQSSFGVNIIQALFPAGESGGFRGGFFVANAADNSTIDGMNIFGSTSFVDSGVIINNGANSIELLATLIRTFNFGVQTLPSAAGTPGTGSSDDLIFDDFIENSSVAAVQLQTGAGNAVTDTFLIDFVQFGLKIANETDLTVDDNVFDSGFAGSIDLFIDP